MRGEGMEVWRLGAVSRTAFPRPVPGGSRHSAAETQKAGSDTLTVACKSAQGLLSTTMLGSEPNERPQTVILNPPRVGQKPVEFAAVVEPHPNTAKTSG